MIDNYNCVNKSCIPIRAPYIYGSKDTAHKISDKIPVLLSRKANVHLNKLSFALTFIEILSESIFGKNFIHNVAFERCFACNVNSALRMYYK